MNYIIITSINGVTKAIEEFAKQSVWHVVVVGDKKSIKYQYPNVTYLSLEEQLKMEYKSVLTTPINHYSRKNIGYLYALSQGAELIYDTDDDTIPYDGEWYSRAFRCNTLVEGGLSINPFRLFTSQEVWPRGLDLNYIKSRKICVERTCFNLVGVWQGIVDQDSDFDAIYRLTQNKPVSFDKRGDICIERGSYAPFNTQSTLWNPQFSMLMYIPISVDFRFTDILRGYIAQKIMWKYDNMVGYHSPNTYQVRNTHNYFDDFLGEINMYKQVPTVLRLLEHTHLDSNLLSDNLVQIYKALFHAGIVQEIELENVSNWIEDMNNIQ